MRFFSVGTDVHKSETLAYPAGVDCVVSQPASAANLYELNDVVQFKIATVLRFFYRRGFSSRRAGRDYLYRNSEGSFSLENDRADAGRRVSGMVIPRLHQRD